MSNFYEFDEEYYRRKSRVWKYIALALVCIMIGAGVMYYAMPYIINDNEESNKVASNEDKQTEYLDSDIGLDEKTDQKLELGAKNLPSIMSDNPVVDIAANVGPAIVGITSKNIVMYRDRFFGDTYYEEQEGYGSGIIISKDGYIVTNHHVVQDAKELYVILQGGEQVEAELIGSDETSDIAVVKIDHENLAIAALGDSDKVNPGEFAVAIGNPLGHDLAGTITFGVISAVNRRLVIGNNAMTLIQTSTPISPGNSGGALVDMNGQVIGMNTLKMQTANNAEGLGFAIPMNIVKPIAEQLILDNGVPVIGITGRELTEEDIMKGKYPHGILIDTLVQNGPSSKAGIKPYDIITAVENKEIQTFEELKAVIYVHEVGDTIKLTVWRDGEYLDFSVVLGSSK